MSRKISDLDPIVGVEAVKLQEECARRGIRIIFTYTLRTHLEQAALWAQGRKSLQEVNDLRKAAGMSPITEKENEHCVTWSMISYHMYGVAIDITILNKNGKPTWDEAFNGNDNLMADYDEVGKIAMEMGWTWGVIKSGHRTDKGHFQWTNGLTLKQLQEGWSPSKMPPAPSGPISNTTITGGA